MKKLALVALVCAAPIVLGTGAYLLGLHGAAGNYGELLAPRVLEAPAFEALRGKWLLVTFDAAACNAACEKKLYVVRQVRRAQGAGAERLERLWLLTDGAKPRPEVLAAIEGAHVQRAAGEERLFPGNALEHIYLVDPLGNLVLAWPRDPDIKKMSTDIGRLLKASRIG